MLGASLALALGACSSSTKSSDEPMAEPVPADTLETPAPTQAAPDTAAAAPAEEHKAADDATEAAAAVEKIYKTSTPFDYTKDPNISASLRGLLKKAVDAAPEGEIGDEPDYNLWTLAQDDVPNLKCSVLSTEPTADGKVKVKVKVSGLGDAETQTIVMKKEDGRWKADDFITSFGSLRSSLR